MIWPVKGSRLKVRGTAHEEEIQSLKNVLGQIHRQLRGIDSEDLTKAEKNILRILESTDY